MAITQNGSIITFTFDDNTAADVWDANGNPIYLYTWLNNGDTSAGSGEVRPTGDWPGTVMTDMGGNIYELSFDLDSFYPIGTLINEINYILNNNMGNQTANLLATNAGYSPFTLSITDINKQDKGVKFINGQLFGSNNVVL